MLCRTVVQNSVTALLTVGPGSGCHYLNTLSQNPSTARPSHQGQSFKHIQHQHISLPVSGQIFKEGLVTQEQLLSTLNLRDTQRILQVDQIVHLQFYSMNMPIQVV